MFLQCKFYLADKQRHYNIWQKYCKIIFIIIFAVKSRTMKPQEVQTMKAVLLYIIQNSNANRRDVYSIVKTAYYAQQIHFAKWASPIFNDKIAALPFGPVPSTIYNILRISRGESEIRRFCKKDNIDSVADAIGFSDESFIAKEEPDLNFLSKSAIECLNESIAKVSEMDFGQIMRDTHGAEWTRVFNDGSLRFMDDLNIAREGGATEDVVNYLRESLEWDEIFG